jgi:hypothetical protein
MTGKEFVQFRDSIEEQIRVLGHRLEVARQAVTIPDGSTLRKAGASDLQTNAVLYGGFDPEYNDSPYFLIVVERTGKGYFWADDGCSYHVDDGFFVERE